MLDILLGQIPEAIYFAIFLIYGKKLKEKRILFTFLLIFEYLFLKHVCMLKYDIYFQIIYTVFVYIILKVLYKEKSQLTDIFLFGSSLLILLFFTVPFLLLNVFVQNIYIVCILSKIFLFIFLYLIRNKIYNIYQKYYSYWNRKERKNPKIKSLTLRNISIVTFNVLFYVTNLIIINIK